MKEAYFSSDTITSVASEMFSAVFPEGQKRAQALDPGRSSLLVLDMQEYFLQPDSHAFIPSAAAILPLINRLIGVFRDHRRPVLFTQHINTEEDAGSMKRWWRDLITADHPHQALVPELDVGQGDVLQKTQYDAFYGSELEKRLEDAGVAQVVVCGVMTHLCCETTARAAFTRGFDVFFTVDGTASYLRSYHQSTLRNLGHGVATLVTCAQVEDAFQEGTR